MVRHHHCTRIAFICGISAVLCSWAHSETHHTRTKVIVEFLLGDDKGIATFFEDHFGSQPFKVHDSSRANRVQWLKSHRKFLQNEDLDSLLKVNASTSKEGAPLRLGQDVDLYRIAKKETGFWGRSRLVSFFPQSQRPKASDSGTATAPEESNTADAVPILTVDHGKLHEAFLDGFEVVVYNMQARSPEVLKYADALSRYWMVPVSAALHFVPNRLSRIKHVAPVFYAEDIFVVQLDGEQTVALYANAIKEPSPGDALRKDVRAAVGAKLESAKPDMHTLREGDVLYVPRGHALDWRTDEKISLHVILHVETYKCSVLDALIKVIDQAQHLATEGNPLQVGLSGDFNALTFADVLRTSSYIAAEAIPEMRAYLPVGHFIAEAFEEADADTSVVLLSRHLEHFVEAGKKALFHPLIDTLAEEHEKSGGEGGKPTVAAWAHKLHASASKAEVAQMEGMFQECLLFAHKHRAKLVIAAHRSTREAHEEDERLNRPDRLQQIAASLQRHGHNIHKDEL